MGSVEEYEEAMHTYTMGGFFFLFSIGGYGGGGGVMMVARSVRCILFCIFQFI